MKKLSIFASMMLAAAALSFAACSKAKADSEVDDEPVKLEFEHVKGQISNDLNGSPTGGI